MTSESQQGVEQPKQQPEGRHMLIFYTWTSVRSSLPTVVCGCAINAIISHSHADPTRKHTHNGFYIHR